MDNYSVYIHIFPNKKVYVGLTKKDVNVRWRNGKGYRKQYVYKAIQKYGWDNIEHIVVADNLTEQKASELEQQLIEKYDSMRNGYNRTQGGETSGGIPIYYEYKEKQYTIYELSEIFNISYHVLKWRFIKGWSVEDAVEIPVEEKYNLYEYNNRTYTIYELAEINGSGITPHGIETRIKRGWNIKDAVEKPLSNNTKDKRTINDKLYSYEELLSYSKVDGLNKKDLISRLSKGWTLTRALTQPKNIKLQPKGLVNVYMNIMGNYIIHMN